MAAGLEDDDLKPRLGKGRRRGCAAGAGADDHHVAFLPPPRGDGVAESPAGSGSVPSARGSGLDADLLLDPGRPRSRGREDFAISSSSWWRAEPGPLHAAQEVVARREAQAAEAPGGTAATRRRVAPNRQADEHPRRERCQELRDRPGDVYIALGHRQAVDAGRHRCADRAQGAFLSGGEPRRAPSTGCRRGAQPCRSATTATAPLRTREPSTRKLSR